MSHSLTHECIPDQQQLSASIQDEFHQSERSINSVRDDVKSLDDRVETQFKSVAYEFGRMHQRFEQVDQRFEQVDQRFEQVNQRFEQVDQRFEQVGADIRHIKVDLQRLSAQAQNGRIRNPHLRINPIVTLDPVSGRTRTPDLTRFPKSAAEFYSLRETTSSRKQGMLEYLIDFYDINHIDVPDDDDDDHATTRSELAVGYLELILGLDENNIIQFRERARELDQWARQPFKRAVETQGSPPQGQRQKLDIRAAPYQDARGWPDNSSSNPSTKLGYDNNPTPESKKEINRKIRELQEKKMTEKLERGREARKQRRRAQGKSSSSHEQDLSEGDNSSEKGAEKEVTESEESGSKTNPNTPRQKGT